MCRKAWSPRGDEWHRGKSSRMPFAMGTGHSRDWSKCARDHVPICVCDREAVVALSWGRGTD